MVWWIVLAIWKSYVLANFFPTLLIMISIFIWCVIFLIYLVDFCCYVNLQGSNLVVHYIGVLRSYNLKFKLDVVLVSDYSKAWSTYPTKVIWFGSMSLFIVLVSSLAFFNIVLKGLKQDVMFRGWKACDVWEVKVIMFKPNFSCAYYIASKVIWLPWPSTISKCWLVRETHLGEGMFTIHKAKIYNKPLFSSLCHFSSNKLVLAISLCPSMLRECTCLTSQQQSWIIVLLTFPN